MRLGMLLTFIFALVSCVSGGELSERAPSSLVLDSSGYAYNPNDRSCDGFPRLNVATAPGTCLGLVLPRNGHNLIMPRTIVQVKDSPDFLLVDMGGWKAGNGAVYLMRYHGGRYELSLLRNSLHMPHGLSYGPDGLIYIGESDKISRFQLKDGKITGWELVFELARGKGYMHPLTQFTFDPRNGDLYVNYGSPTDHCMIEGTGAYQTCPEEHSRGQGAIRRIPGVLLKKKLPPGGIPTAEQTASGLRNSMAMVVHPSGTLVQGENGRDFPELEEPFEELNVIDLSFTGLHYGWPYCYDFHALSPEWAYKENVASPMRKSFQTPRDCMNRQAQGIGEYQPPWILLPPHSAPLHMSYYQGDMFPSWQGKLLVSLHGYQPTGHRIVMFDVDGKGRPLLQAEGKPASFGADQKGRCPVWKNYSPRAGLDRSAQHTELISGWDQRKGVRPKGAPVGFTVARDGSVFIVEDRENRTVVRLAQSNTVSTSDCDQPDSDAADPRIELLAWRRAANRSAQVREGLAAAQAGVVSKFCASCHGGFVEKDIAQDKYMLLDFLVKNEWFMPGESQNSKIVQAIAQTGQFPGMPPTGQPQILGNREAEAAFAAMKNWIDRLPRDVEKTYQKIEIGSGRKIRAAPGSSGAECGRFEPGETIYVNPGDRVTKEGWVWSEVYILPKDSRLFVGKCTYPSDGVYWIALTKAR